MPKRSDVMCGECGEGTIFIVCVWPPTFFWCRHCGLVFTYVEVKQDNAVTWQLRGFPNHD